MGCNTSRRVTEVEVQEGDWNTAYNAQMGTFGRSHTGVITREKTVEACANFGVRSRRLESRGLPRDCTSHPCGC